MRKRFPTTFSYLVWAITRMSVTLVVSLSLSLEKAGNGTWPLWPHAALQYCSNHCSKHCSVLVVPAWQPLQLPRDLCVPEQLHVDRVPGRVGFQHLWHHCTLARIFQVGIILLHSRVNTFNYSNEDNSKKER